MNETTEPDLIEKGFRNFGKINKNLTSTINRANQLATEQMKKTATQPGVQNLFASHGFMIVIMGIFIIFMLFTSNYSMSMNYETSWLGIPILLILAYGLYSFVTPMRASNDWISPLLTNTLIIAFSGLLIYYYTQLSQQTNTNLSDAYAILSVLMLFVSLAIVFYFLGEYIKRLEGLPGLIAQFVFYLPCLILQFVNYIKKDFRDTTSTVFYLFVIELILILLYIYYLYTK